MVLQFDPFSFHIILLILCSMHMLGYTQYTETMAQHGCNSSCGDVDIPYPFGMNDPKCYADKWFEIECMNSTSDYGGYIKKPYLKLNSKLVEVSSISVTLAIVLIKNPIHRWNCRSALSMSQQAVDLRGSPFVYSQKINKFVSIGCNKIAFLMSNGTQVNGCVSICDDNEDVEADLATYTCNGKSCCETSLPLYLSEYNVTTENLQNSGHGGGESGDQCHYAMIVAEGSDEYQQNFRYFGDFNDFKHRKYSVAALEWEIVNSTVKLPQHYCWNTNVTSSQHAHSGRRCGCNPYYHEVPYDDGLFGYRGNPKTQCL